MHDERGNPQTAGSWGTRVLTSAVVSEMPLETSVTVSVVCSEHAAIFGMLEVWGRRVTNEREAFADRRRVVAR